MGRMMGKALGLALLLGLLLALAGVAGADVIDVGTRLGSVDIPDNGSGWKYEAPVAGVSVGRLRFTGDGSHTLTGTNGNLTIFLSVGVDVSLTLRGLRISAVGEPAVTSAGLHAPGGTRLRLTLADGTSNSIVATESCLVLLNGQQTVIDGEGSLSLTVQPMGGYGNACFGINMGGASLTIRGGARVSAAGANGGGADVDAGGGLRLDSPHASLELLTGTMSVSGNPNNHLFPGGTPHGHFRNGRISGGGWAGYWRGGYLNNSLGSYAFLSPFGTHTLGGSEALSGTVDADFARFQAGGTPFTGVSVAGQVLPAGSYLYEAGSTVVKLTPAYLNGLAPGSYPITVHFVDGDAAGTFRVVGPPVPPTGDDGYMGLYMLLLVICGFGLWFSMRPRKAKA